MKANMQLLKMKVGHTMKAHMVQLLKMKVTAVEGKHHTHSAEEHVKHNEATDTMPRCRSKKCDIL